MENQLPTPNVTEAIKQYRQHARGYDASAQRTMQMRIRTIDRLQLTPGQRVLDVACGTGLSFPMLRQAVGPAGEVVGIDVSPEMTQLARERVNQAGWNNVTALESAIDQAPLNGQFDAVLFNFTHDVMRAPDALQRVFNALRPGGRVAIAGMKYLPWYLAPMNIIVRAKARPYMSTFEGLEMPWNHALPYLDDFQWVSCFCGICYIGWGQRNSSRA